MTKQLYFDGTKAVSLWDVDSNRGWEVIGRHGLEGEALYYARVPWLFRGVRDRANNVSRMAWYIVNGDVDVDQLSSYSNALGFWPNPRRTLHLLEQSITMMGKAYLFLETNKFGVIKAVKYCVPTSITEVYDTETGLITGYKRRVGSKTMDVSPENIVAIYDPDYLTENGPGATSAGEAALMAAGALFNVSRFVAEFFRRGAVKASVLTVTNTSQPEAERLQTWWEDVVTGIRNAWSAIVLRGDNVKPVIIGEGLESLQNDSLTKEQRQDIATAMGVPESRMWSAAANYATREMDEKSYYEGTIIPECDLISEALNTQMFTASHRLSGYRMEARYETLDIFQKDAAEQAGAYQSYIASGMKPSVAAQVLGIELPNGMEYEDLDPEIETEEDQPEQPEQPTAAEQQQQQPNVEDNTQSAALAAPAATELETRSVLAAWRRKAENAIKRGKAADVEFTTEIIPAWQRDDLHEALRECNTIEAVRAVFDVHNHDQQAETANDRLADELSRANEILAYVRATHD